MEGSEGVKTKRERDRDLFFKKLTTWLKKKKTDVLAIHFQMEAQTLQQSRGEEGADLSGNWGGSLEGYIKSRLLNGI